MRLTTREDAEEGFLREAGKIDWNEWRASACWAITAVERLVKSCRDGQMSVGACVRYTEGILDALNSLDEASAALQDMLKEDLKRDLKGGA